MDNSNKTNCCTSNGNSKKRSASMKQKIGISIFSIALIFALNTAFKGVTEAKVSCSTTTGLTTISIADFKWIQTDKKVVYIVLKGSNTNQNQKIVSKVKSIVNELNETDGSAHFLVLEANNSNYQDVVSKLKIEEIPSIAVLGKSAATIKGANMNSYKLIRAYDTASSVSDSCVTAEKTNCGGKNKATCSSSKKSNQ